ncbi:MAG: serine/threonine protein kinase [Alphaproteobacteria bacterium]|nr:serine/threonine protein kinase [Alphaproteobacteria bacterium]
MAGQSPPDAAPDTSLEVFPDAIGPYPCRRLLGRGGMAAVYLCEGSDGGLVAVKWLARATPSQQARFRREVDVLTRLRHEHIVKVLDSGTCEGRPYLVMEYVEGPDLRIYAHKLKQRPASERYAEVCRIGMELCDALTAVHAQGLVHRDLKPSNVLLDPRGRCRLADFGVVKDIDDPEGTPTSFMVGTRAYAAPEQLQARVIDHRADLYGLGCTLYYLLTGERPYPVKDETQLMRAHLHTPVPHPTSIDPDIPPSLEAVVMRLMAKKPADRFPTAGATGAALSRARTTRPPPPLAGRRRYVDLASAALDRVETEGGRVIRVRGPRGSGRSWLMDVIEDLARRREVPCMVAHDSPALGAALKRLRSGEHLAVVTRLPVPRGRAPLPVDPIQLEPLGIADVRRSVVAAAPGTEVPHEVAERLHRASGGHPSWLLSLMAEHTEGDRIILPDPLPPPARIRDKVSLLSEDALETLRALAALHRPADAALLELIVQRPVDSALLALREQAFVTVHKDEWVLFGDAVGVAALGGEPVPPELHQRVAAALRHRGLEAEAAGHLADCPTRAGCDADPFAHLARIEQAALEGDLTGAREQAEDALTRARAARRRDIELIATRVLGEVLLDQGHTRLAESRLADAVALARALDVPHERRYAHVLRAAATLENRPGSHVAAAAALDRLHRALTRVETRGEDPSRALAQAVRAHAAATLGDRRAWERATVAAEAGRDTLPPRFRARVDLSLARAALAAGANAEAARRARALSAEARAEGLTLVGWLADCIAAVACGAPRPKLSVEDIVTEDTEALEGRPVA